MHGILVPCFLCMGEEVLMDSMCAVTVFFIGLLHLVQYEGGVKNTVINVVFLMVICVSDLLHLILSLWLQCGYFV